MTMLLTQIFFCLLIAAAIGAATVWLLCRNVALRREEIFQQDWKNRVRQIEGDRDRTAAGGAPELQTPHLPVHWGHERTIVPDWVSRDLYCR